MSADLPPDDLVALNRLTIVARVLAGTAHDVNNALQVIDGSAELLEHQTNGSDGAQRAVQRIRSHAARAAAVVAEVMKLVRPDIARPRLVRLRDVAVKAVAMRAYPIRRAGLTLEFTPAVLPEGLVNGDAGQLQQVVLNLLINAEQALAGQPGGTVAIDVREEGSDAVLRVCDNGNGMDAQLGDRVFDPFVTTRPVADATGLGLAVARILARAHSGDVALVAGSPGCCATLRLPLAAAPAAQ